jgi:hypothetical protein
MAITLPVFTSMQESLPRAQLGLMWQGQATNQTCETGPPVRGDWRDGLPVAARLDISDNA